jgi:hypothetical protein
MFVVSQYLYHQSQLLPTPVSSFLQRVNKLRILPILKTKPPRHNINMPLTIYKP